MLPALMSEDNLTQRTSIEPCIIQWICLYIKRVLHLMNQVMTGLLILLSIISNAYSENIPKLFLVIKSCPKFFWPILWCWIIALSSTTSTTLLSYLCCYPDSPTYTSFDFIQHAAASLLLLLLMVNSHGITSKDSSTDLTIEMCISEAQISNDIT